MQTSNCSVRNQPLYIFLYCERSWGCDILYKHTYKHISVYGCWISYGRYSFRLVTRGQINKHNFLKIDFTATIAANWPVDKNLANERYLPSLSQRKEPLKTYVGTTSNTFKIRRVNHKQSFKIPSYKLSPLYFTTPTTLFNCMWKLKTQK